MNKITPKIIQNIQGNTKKEKKTQIFYTYLSNTLFWSIIIQNKMT